MTVVEVSDWYGSSSQRGELGRLPKLASSYPGAGPFLLRDQPSQPRELVGRDRDLAVIAAFVAELPARGGSLLLRGEPGVGKSALLDTAEAQAETANVRVLRAAGAEFEDASFLALNQLLLPLAGDLDRLNDLQRTALDVALGFDDGPGCGRLARVSEIRGESRLFRLVSMVAGVVLAYYPCQRLGA